jgi:ankyrin repeat protein
MLMLCLQDRSIGAISDKGESLLTLAVRYEHEQLVRILLHRGTAPDSGGPHGRSPLHWATDLNNLRIVHALIAAGASVGILEEGMTPLHRAASKGYLDVMKLLLSMGAEIEALDMGDATPLAYAARSGHFQACMLLLSRGADPLHLSTRNVSPIEEAVTSASLTTVDTLVQSLLPPDRVVECLASGPGAETLCSQRDHQCQTELLKAMRRAARAGYSGLVAKIGSILTHAFRVRPTEPMFREALLSAVRHRNPEVVRTLIALGVSPGSGGKPTPLAIAAGTGELAMVQLLIDHGARDSTGTKSFLNLRVLFSLHDRY